MEQEKGFPQVDLPKRDLGGSLLQLLLHVGGGLEEEPEPDRGGMGRRQQTGRYRCRIGIAPSLCTFGSVKVSKLGYRASKKG